MLTCLRAFEEAAHKRDVWFVGEGQTVRTRQISYGEIAEGIGRMLYELLEKNPTPPWPLIAFFFVPLVLLVIAAVNMSAPALVLVAAVAWLASARLDANPAMRLGAVCLGFIVGLAIFHIVFLGTDFERHSASFAMGFSRVLRRAARGCSRMGNRLVSSASAG